MRDAPRIARAVAIALACAGSPAFGDDAPNPALLEYLGAAARAEGSGIDVDRLVEERLANARGNERTHDAEVNDRLEGDDG